MDAQHLPEQTTEQPLAPPPAHPSRGHTKLRARLLAHEGQSLVEFAMVLPLILLIVFGVVDFGQAYNYKNQETSIANQAARYAEVNACPVPDNTSPTPPCTVSIPTAVAKDSGSSELQSGSNSNLGIAPPGITISFCLPNGSAGTVGSQLETNVTSSYRWMPFLQLGNVAIGATVISRIEQAPDSTHPSAYGTLSAC